MKRGGWNDQYRDPRLIPDRIVRMMSPADRARLGRRCRTNDERAVEHQARTEKQLQANIEALLRQRDICFNRSRMDCATTGRVGWPDFTFAVNGLACAIEVKLPGAEPTTEQVKVMRALIKDGWFVRVVRSEAEFLKALKEAGGATRARHSPRISYAAERRPAVRSASAGRDQAEQVPGDGAFLL